MKQLIEEQLNQFEKQKEVYMTDLRAYYHSQWNGTDEEKEVYRIEAEKSRNVLNEWYVTSLKQFIDELIAENEHQDGKLYGFDIIATEKETPTNDYIEGYKQGFKIKKKTIYDHLKKLKEELN